MALHDSVPSRWRNHFKYSEYILTPRPSSLYNATSVKSDELAITRLLLNDQFLEYACSDSDTLGDLLKQDEISSLASSEVIRAAREIILRQNRDLATLDSDESEELKNAILATLHSPGNSAPHC